VRSKNMPLLSKNTPDSWEERTVLTERGVILQEDQQEVVKKSYLHLW